MSRLISQFWSICMFKAGPQDLPYSVGLMRATLAISALSGFLILQFSTTDTALAQVLVDIALGAAYIWPLLYFAGFRHRFTQTWSAWLGTDVIVNLFASVPLYNLGTNPSNANSIMLLLLLIWHIAIYAHIFRHALGRGWVMGIGLALFYMMVSSQIMGELFPVVTNVAQ